jgi:hypothetical protein
MKDNIVKEIREFCESNHFPRIADLEEQVDYWKAKAKRPEVDETVKLDRLLDICEVDKPKPKPIANPEQQQENLEALLRQLDS